MKNSSKALRTWGIRAGAAIATGLLIGVAGGIFTVNTLEPGRGNGVDSLQVMLDSIARGTLPETSAKPREVESRGGADNADVLTRTSPANGRIPVPDVVGLEEGDARNAILDAGFQVGDIQFRASAQPPGVVLSTIPARGTPLPSGGLVALVLSDGRAGADSLAGELKPVPFPSSLPRP
jgi:hypothetical protein